MFIIRTAFWLGIIVMLLPADKDAQQRIYGNAGDMLGRAVTFCDRNQELCKRGSEAWVVFKTKAEFAGRMAMELGAEHLLGRGESVTPPAPVASGPSRGTLRADDLAPRWRADRGGRI